MKKTLLSATAISLALASGSAPAADLPPLNAPMLISSPPLLWTGFHAGVNAGYEWSNNNIVNVLSTPLFPGYPPMLLAEQGSGNVPVKSSGFIGGGQIGYTYQFGARFVVGVEADIQGLAGASGDGTLSRATRLLTQPIASILTATKSLDYLATVRGRAGFLLTPTLLLYGTGGLAYGGVTTGANLSQFISYIFPFPLTISGISRASNSRVGWTAGGGGEWMFCPNWSAKLEYLYFDLGSVTHATVTSFVIPVFEPYQTTRSTARYNGHVIRAGLNYHLNWGAPPVVASY